MVSDKIKKKMLINWNIGQACALFSSVLIGFEFKSAALAVLSFFLLGILVDIRALLSD